MTSTSRESSRSRSGTPEEQPGGSQLVYVSRSPLPRRGALGASALRLSTDSEDDEDMPGTPTFESSAATANLARPHPSPSKLVVHSSTSSGPASNLNDEEESDPILAPSHRKGAGVPQHLLGSTQDEDSMNSLLRFDDSAFVEEGENAVPWRRMSRCLTGRGRDLRMDQGL